MDNLSDAIILGRPELSALGLYLEPEDENGRLWVQLCSSGVRLPVIQPSQSGKPRTFKIDEPVIVKGPDLVSLPVVISENDYRHYTH